jgi:hypothetical protein
LSVESEIRHIIIKEEKGGTPLLLSLKRSFLAIRIFLQDKQQSLPNTLYNQEMLSTKEILIYYPSTSQMHQNKVQHEQVEELLQKGKPRAEPIRKLSFSFS